MRTSKFKNPRAKHDFKGRTCSIISVGSYVPEKVITNADLEKMVETSDEWITTRTGIKQRRKAAPNEYTSLFAVRAARGWTVSTIATPAWRGWAAGRKRRREGGAWRRWVPLAFSWLPGSRSSPCSGGFGEVSPPDEGETEGK